MKRIINTILSLTFCLLIQAQIPQAPKNLQSPNATSLGLYGEVPVSLFTGIPEIFIPLFTAPDKYKGFSVGLSYHAGGVRPDQHPGWMGTNWSLIAGGCISRTIKDADDEYSAIDGTGTTGFYFNYSILNTTDWNSVDNISSIALNYKSLTYKDTQPDEFSFYFGDYSGKFYLNQAGQWIVQCNKPVKVTFDGNFIDPPNSLIYVTGSSFLITQAQQQRTKSFKSFSIYTEDGTQYIFGNDTTAIEYSMPFFDQLHSTWVANSWYLTKINYTNGKYIDLKYQRGNKVNQMYISNTQLLSQTITFGGTDLNCSSIGSSSADINKSYSGELISPIYLNSIESPDFSVQFRRNPTYELRYNDSIYATVVDYFNNYCSSNNLSCSAKDYFPYMNNGPSSYTIYDFLHNNLSWALLDTIKIYDYNQTLIKKFDLNYNNGAGATGDPRLTSKERLFLLSINEKNGSGSLKGTYSFEYDNRDKLPSYLANKTDHWGFYNNKYAYLNNPSAYYGYREPDSTVMKYGSLRKITYPTGGSTEFVYEANQYSRQLKLNRWLGDSIVGGNKITGGLRIKRITNNPNNGQNAIVKEYFYIRDYSLTNQTGTSSGVLGGQVKYLFNDYQVKNSGANYMNGGPFYFGQSVTGDLIVKKTYFSTQSVLPVCTNSMGSPIGYSEVVEKISDGSFTCYKYSNFDNGYLDEKFDNALQLSITPYQPYNSKVQERGNILAKEVYDATGKLQYKETNTYVKSSLSYIRSISAKSILLCADLASYYLEGTANKIYTYSMLLSNKKDITYNNTDSLVKETKFKYDSNFPVVVNQTEKDSHGDSITTVYTYPFHLEKNYLANAPATSSTLGSRSISTTLYANCRNMYYLNFLKSPVEITSYKNNKVIGSKLFYYGRHGNAYLPDSIYSLETTSSLNTFMRYCDPNVGPGPYLIDGRYEKSPSLSYKYDAQSNIIQISQNHGVST
ncbi:MAG: hypothetical protein PHS84_11415, partial [Paludibacter sp.]|nr:hypothetical protein [Paludibacter sp.]